MKARIANCDGGWGVHLEISPQDDLRSGDANGGVVLACPVCRGDYTRLEDSYVAHGYESAGLRRKTALHIVHPKRRYDSRDYRGDTLVLEFSCEDGHRFALRFSQHKGNTFVGAEAL